MERLGNTPKRPEPVRISSVEDLISHGGSVVKYTQDGGKSWNFAILWKVSELEMFYDAGRGVATYEEVSPKGVHTRASLTERHFNDPDFAVFATTPDEVAGKKFSYR